MTSKNDSDYGFVSDQSGSDNKKEEKNNQYTSDWNYANGNKLIFRGTFFRVATQILGYLSLIAGVILLFYFIDKYKTINMNYRAPKELLSHYSISAWTSFFSGIAGWIICCLIASIHNNQELIVKELKSKKDSNVLEQKEKR